MCPHSAIYVSSYYCCHRGGPDLLQEIKQKKHQELETEEGGEKGGKDEGKEEKEAKKDCRPCLADALVCMCHILADRHISR